MSGAFKNECSICGKPFVDGDKAVVQALVVVTKGGYSNLTRGQKICPKEKVQIRFRSGTKRELVCTSCKKENELVKFAQWCTSKNFDSRELSTRARMALDKGVV